MKTKTILTTLLLSCTFSLTTQAGIWIPDDTGWYWNGATKNDYPNQWQWLDGNHDGVYECYYFSEDGHCLLDTTTPDGYQVNEFGAWVQDGQVQTKKPPMF